MTGNFHTTAKLSASWNAPILVVPSPKKQTATSVPPRYCARQADPQAIGRGAPTIAYDPDTPCSTEVRCIEPPLPRIRPMSRSISSPSMPSIEAPRASVCAWPRYVQNDLSPSRIATPNPAATASWPIDKWLVPLIMFCRKRSKARFSQSRISTWRRNNSKRRSNPMSSFRKRSPPVVAPDAEAMLVVPAQSLCCSRLTENGAATSEKNPQNGNFAGSLLGRAGSRQPYERSVALACHRFFAHRETHVPENPHFGQIRPSRVRAAVLKRRLQRALALQLLAKSNRLRKGGCALKRLSEDFRVCHGRGWLDQGAP